MPGQDRKLKQLVEAAVRVMTFLVGQHYATPTPSPDAVTGYITSFMSWLASWSAFLNSLPPQQIEKFKYLSRFVADMQYTLSTHIGRHCLGQRVDDIKTNPCPTTWRLFDTFMESLTAELEDIVGPLRAWVADQPVDTGLLCDQILHAILLFGTRCEMFLADRLTRQLNIFVRKFTNDVYDHQTLNAVAQTPTRGAITAVD